MKNLFLFTIFSLLTVSTMAAPVAAPVHPPAEPIADAPVDAPVAAPVAGLDVGLNAAPVDGLVAAPVTAYVERFVFLFSQPLYVSLTLFEFIIDLKPATMIRMW